MLINNNVSSSENLETSNKVWSSSLYLHNRNNTSLARKNKNETMNKITTVSHVKNDSPISMVNIVMTKSDNSYANQVMISNTTLHSREKISNDARNNASTVSNKEAAIFPNYDYDSTIPFINEGVSNENELIGNMISRREKEDKPIRCIN